MFWCNLLERAGRSIRWAVPGVVFFAGIIFLNAAACSGAADRGNLPFAFETVIQQAGELADKSYALPDNQAPKYLLDLSYDQWRDIRFLPEKSLWRSENLPFEVQFFHLGCFYNYPVDVQVVEGGKVTHFPFSPTQFHYGQNRITEKIPDVGFAGLRYHYNINRPDYKDEVAVFLGASYFRAIGKNQQYGLSARGLAIDTGLESGEEFPVFKKFWLVKPAPDATEAVLYALLDSKSYAGAYKFTIRAGEKTVMSVESRLFQRTPVKKLGIAPLTSMFFFGETDNIPPKDDFRPEVHDSDGVLVAQTNGEWIWYPLQNPKTLAFSIFQAPNPAGFGLLQRDLNFDHYQDLEARYDKRPSAWITPKRGDWGKGHVETVLIPTDSEVNDNIVTFWVPEVPPEKKRLTFDYDISWYSPRQSPHGGGYVIGTRTMSDKKAGTRTFLIDFMGGGLDQLGGDVYPSEVVSASGKINIIEQYVQQNPFINGWRLVFKIRTSENTIGKVLTKSEPINLRAFLRRDKDILTETWSYTFYP